MTYHQDLGEISEEMWCSELTAANPDGSTRCNAIFGLCLPMDASTLSIYKDIQRNINRLASVQGNALIDVDGRLGPATVKALNMATGIDVARCDDIARNATNILITLNTQANQAGAPVVADPTPKFPPSMPSGGGVSHPPADVLQDSKRDQEGILGMLKTPLGMAAMVVGGILLWKMTAVHANPARRRRRRRR